MVLAIPVLGDEGKAASCENGCAHNKIEGEAEMG